MIIQISEELLPHFSHPHQQIKLKRGGTGKDEERRMEADLFLPQRFDRIQLRRFMCRIPAKEKTNGSCGAESKHHGRG